ncbi:lytic murein transglycosylase B [Marinihelvus fidelis]|uniref:Lytic murein transglycosylase B n=1 Tax=Marinihelvus fidelis TaxID=2613842 RepID=A0A5N0TA59_9GAMM|nr:lytic murein transglycosylase B [Marinihelvus fidelis]KAA9131017.1 lytic murein transglycosylase B [Marinihelvus fidelis]
MTRTPLLFLLVSLAPMAVAETHPGEDAFIEKAVAEHGLDAASVRALLGGAEFKQSIADAIARPAEGKPWYDYRPIFITDQRIAEGVAFWRENEALINQVSEQFGVDPQFIVSIIGVETFYGRITGNYRVLDSLATLSFHYPSDRTRDRSEFFSSELMNYLLLGSEEELPLEEVTGSYAGAMGMGQFMPSSYRAYAVDFDDDGRRDLWRSRPDAIASVANYLAEHGWEAGGPVARRAKAGEGADFSLLKAGYKPELTVLDLHEKGYRSATDLDPEREAALVSLEQQDRDEYWMVFHNFYVITRYNRSKMYAMAVYQLSEALREGMAP